MNKMLVPRLGKPEMQPWGANPKNPKKNAYQRTPRTVCGENHGPWWSAMGHGLGF